MLRSGFSPLAGFCPGQLWTNAPWRHDESGWHDEPGADAANASEHVSDAGDDAGNAQRQVRRRAPAYPRATHGVHAAAYAVDAWRRRPGHDGTAPGAVGWWPGHG